MNANHAQSIVLTTGMLVFFMGWFVSAKAGKPVPSGQFLIGTSVLFLILEVIADVSPELAAAIAVGVGTTAFFHYGPTILPFISGTDAAVTPTTTTPTTTTTATTGAATVGAGVTHVAGQR